MQKNAKKTFSKIFHFFHPMTLLKSIYLTKEVVTHYTFKEYIHLPSKKFGTKKIDKQGRY